MFNWADWLILAILAISSLISLKRGFVKEAMSLAIWLLAFVLAIWLSPRLAPMLASLLDAVSLRQIAAFGIIFIATLITGSAVNYLLSTLIKATGLSGTDRMLGILFGLVRGLIIVMVAALYLPKLIAVNQDVWWQQSALLPYFQDFEERFLSFTRSAYGLAKDYF
jgi:membrane protein required for colicin V production